MSNKIEKFDEFMERHGFKHGVAKNLEDLIYWGSIYCYQNNGNWRQHIARIRKTFSSYQELGRNETIIDNYFMLKTKFYKALSEILIEDNELTHWFDTSKVSGWPNIKTEDDDNDPLDMENCGYLTLSDTEFVMVCGGDWQDPHKVTIVMGVDGLEVSNCEPWDFDGTSDDFEEELSNKLFVHKHFG